MISKLGDLEKKLLEYNITIKVEKSEFMSDIFPSEMLNLIFPDGTVLYIKPYTNSREDVFINAGTLRQISKKH